MCCQATGETFLSWAADGWHPKSQRERRQLRPEKEVDTRRARSTPAKAGTRRTYQSPDEGSQPLKGQCIPLPRQNGRKQQVIFGMHLFGALCQKPQYEYPHPSKNSYVAFRTFMQVYPILRYLALEKILIITDLGEALTY